MMKVAVFYILCILLCNLGSMCPAAQAVTVTDMAGRQVTAPFDPDRILCIGPGALRQIVYLQAAAKVVGVEAMEKRNPGGRPYWIAHPELHRLPRCGPGGPASIDKKPDLETILSLKPQVIFVTYMDRCLADEVQQTLRIPVIVLNYGTFFATFDPAVFYASMRVAGRLLDRQSRAEKIVAYVESLRRDLHARTAVIPQDRKPRVYVGGIGYRGAYGLGSTDQHYIPFTWVRADNVAEQVKASRASHIFIDTEGLLQLNPDIVFIDGGGLALVTDDYHKRPDFYHALKAFTDCRVYTLLPFNWYTTNVGTALADAYAIGKILYPKRFEDIVAEHKADEIYTFLVGKPVYRQMAKDYGAIGRPAPFLDCATKSSARKPGLPEK